MNLRHVHTERQRSRFWIGPEHNWILTLVLMLMLMLTLGMNDRIEINVFLSRVKRESQRWRSVWMRRWMARQGLWNAKLNGPEVKSGGHRPMDFPPVPRVLPLC